MERGLIFGAGNKVLRGTLSAQRASRRGRRSASYEESLALSELRGVLGAQRATRRARGSVIYKERKALSELLI